MEYSIRKRKKDVEMLEEMKKMKKVKKIQSFPFFVVGLRRVGRVGTFFLESTSAELILSEKQQKVYC